MPRSSPPADSPMSSSTPSPSTMTTSTAVKKKKSRRPKENPFLQQELPSCRPIITISFAIAILFALGCLLIPIGSIALFASSSVVEVVKRYDVECGPYFSPDSNSSNSNCEIYLKVLKTMHRPIYIYYELDNFYQNHRRYESSFSRDELLGLSVSRDSREESCRPEDVVRGVDGNPIEPLTPIVPCGLIAWSRFNDTFSFEFARGLNSDPSSFLNVIKERISWVSDKEKFSDRPIVEREGNQEGGNESEMVRIERRFQGPTLREDEDLIVWMRISPFSRFRKLWGILDRTLRQGDKLKVHINNRFNSYAYKGNKKIVLSTSGWLGGANLFLPASYLVTGTFCLSASICFLFLRWLFPREIGDESNLSWNWKRAEDGGGTEMSM